MKRIKTLPQLFPYATRAVLSCVLMVSLLLSLVPVGPVAAQDPATDPSLANLDLNDDGQITEIDLMYVTTAWESRKISGDPCSGPAAEDVNGDGCITIADIQLVAANIGTVVIDQAEMSDQAQAMISTDPTFVVTTTSDLPDANPGDGICQIAGGGCSLRAAIDEANRMPGANTINFNIPGNGPHVINVAATDSSDRAFTIFDTSGPTIINGYSQPGASPNTSPTVSNAVVKIHIKGPRVANTSVRNYRSIDGIRVFSAGNEFRGLAFTHLRRSIWISGPNAHDNIVAGTFIGTDPAGQNWYAAIRAIEGRSNDDGAYGIWLGEGAHHNRIGGTDPADRSVISGNANDGGGGSGEGTDYNQFIGLLIGLSPDGTRRVPNASDGLDLNSGMSYTQIGGLAPGERNVISGNSGEGVEISHGVQTEYNVIAGNYFGTAPDGNTIVDGIHFNAGYSVSLEDNPSNNIVGPGNVMVNSFHGGIHIYGALGTGNQIFGNRIGITLDGTTNALTQNRGDGVRIRFGGSGNVIGPDNIITNNTETGVLVIDNSSQRNTITRNSIYSNALLGIDLGGNKDTGGDGVSVNDGSWGSGPNQRVDYPVITSATTATVAGTALPGYQVEVFIADAAAGQHGEGRTFVGSGISDGSGHFTIPISGVSGGQVLTATSTDSAGNTSEFSVNVTVVGAPVNTPPTASIAAPTNGATVSGTVSIDINANDAENAAGTLNVRVRIDGGDWQTAGWDAGSSRYRYAWNTATVGNGNHTIEAQVTDSASAVATAGPINVSVNNVGDSVHQLPGIIQVEDYYAGGEGVGYHDLSAGNAGGKYRSDNVDIENCSDPTTLAGQSCYNVGWTEAGEWLAYNVRVPSAGNYTFALRVSTPSNSRRVQLQLDGVNLGAQITLPNTGGYQAWQTVTVTRQLPAGDHQLRIVVSTANLNLNYVEITAAANTPPTASIATPSNGATVSGTTTVAVAASDAQDGAGSLNVQVRIDAGDWQPASWNVAAGQYQFVWDTTSASNGAHTIHARATDSSQATVTASSISVTVNNVSTPRFTLPTLIQTEDYKDGGEGVGYHDSTPGNNGNRYRSDDVDIETCTDPTTAAGQDCYNVGWTDTSEWLAYNVHVPVAGTYTFALRVSTPSNNRRVQIQIDGVDLGAPVLVPNTAGYQNWQTVTAVRQLSAGDHELRLLISAGNMNLNYVDITSAAANTAPTVSIATPANGATVSGTTTVGITATDAQDATGALAVQVRIDGGAWLTAGWNAGAGRYEYSWNTTTLANGNHTLEARATDSSGLTGTAGSITVAVNNQSAVVLPATIQAEDYTDYHDSDAGNVGGAYRDDDVDIGTCSDGSNCYYVGWTVKGEWLEYDVSTSSAATYTIRLRYASPAANRRVKVEVDGTLISTTSLTTSGGWDIWRDAPIGTVNLTPGQHTIRLLIDLDALNINWLSFTR